MKGLFLEQQQSNIKTTVHNKRIFMTWKIKQDCFALQATQMCTVRFKLHKRAQYTSSYTNVHSTLQATQMCTVHFKLHKCAVTWSYTNVHSTLQATQMCTVHFKLHKCAQHTSRYTNVHSTLQATQMCTVHLQLPLSCPILMTLDHTSVCKDQRVCQ